MKSFIKNKMYNLIGLSILLILSFLLLHFIHKKLHSKDKEGFQWTPESTKRFLTIQHQINPDKVFDVDMIQKMQASQKEVDYFNKNGTWPWSVKTKKLYIEAIKKNPYVRTFPEVSLQYAMTIYNENAILQVLSYQSKKVAS